MGRPARKLKRVHSLSDEQPHNDVKRSQVVEPEITQDTSSPTTSFSSSAMPRAALLGPPKQSPVPYNPDIRKSVPYFLPPPPPPAFLTNEALPMAPVYDPYMRMVPLPIQYAHQFQGQGQGQVQGHGQQPLVPFMPPGPFPQAPVSPQKTPTTTDKLDIPSRQNNGALDALAELSERVGSELTSTDVKLINKTLVTRQYQKALAVSSKLFQFVKNVINGSEISENVDSVTFKQLDENYKAAKELTEILGDWRDILDADENEHEELSFHLTTVDSVVCGLSDPNIQLVLPPYQPVGRIERKKQDLSDTPLDSIKNLNRKHKKLVYGMCDQCEVMETIQWRRGPNGERSLCNACGLFYTKLVRKLGQELAGQLLAQRKFAGNANDRRIPPALLVDDIIHYYIVEELDTGLRQEVNVKDLGKLDCFDDSTDPPRLKKKVVLMPLIEKLAEVVLDITNMNSKYDPSHEISTVKERKTEGVSASTGTLDVSENKPIDTKTKNLT